MWKLSGCCAKISLVWLRNHESKQILNALRELSTRVVIKKCLLIKLAEDIHPLPLQDLERIKIVPEYDSYAFDLAGNLTKQQVRTARQSWDYFAFSGSIGGQDLVIVRRKRWPYLKSEIALGSSLGFWPNVLTRPCLWHHGPTEVGT